MFPRNDEEMGRALNNLAVELFRRKKINKEKYERFLKWWYSSPRYLEIKTDPRYNRRYWEDEAGYRRNAWWVWLEAESEAERERDSQV